MRDGVGVLIAIGYTGLALSSVHLAKNRDHRGGSMKIRTVCVMLMLGAILFLMVPSLPAQSAGTGGLGGTVTDPSGAVIPNVTVTATSVSTGQSRTATTGQDGSYKISLLPPGQYRVKFEATGFGATEIPSVTVAVTEVGTLNEALKVGGTTQEVTVQADVEAVQTASSTIGTVVQAQTVTDLPLTTRNYQNLIGMSAGANASVSNATALGKATSTTAVNGASNAQNNFQMDGAPVDNWLSFGNGAEGGFYGAQGIPSPDAIQEFKIQTSNYDASYGRNPGANVNLVTKSGTNDFHGVAFEFLRNTVFNANQWFQNQVHGPRLVLNQNQYGGVIGGPVKKDKLFFFVSYQETGQKNGITATGSSNVTLPPVPNVANRGTCPLAATTVAGCDAAGQAFAGLLGAAVCPTLNPGNKFDTITTSGSITVACDGSDINVVAMRILQLKLANGNYYVPSSTPSTPGAYVTASFTNPARYEEHQGLGNWDYIINSKNTLSGRYFYGTDPSTGNFPAATSLPGANFTTDFINHEAVLKLTTVINNNWVNEARISYQRNISNNNLNAGQLTESAIGMAPLSPGLDIMPLIAISGIFTLGNQGFNFVYVPQNQYQWADQLSWTPGKHTVRVGTEFERVQADPLVPGLGVGQPALGSFPDFLIGRAGCTPISPTCNGTGLSNITGVGTTSSVVSNGGFASHDFRANDANAFFQDDYKILPRLTLNLGLRWEYAGYASMKQGVLATIWPSAIAQQPFPGNSPATGSLVGFVAVANYPGTVPTGVLRAKTKDPEGSGPPLDDFAPRLGFAWQPLTTNRLVIRGGAGYFYDRAAGGDFVNPLYNSQPLQIQPTQSPLSTLQAPFILPATVPAAPGSIGFTPRWYNFANNTGSNIANQTIQEGITVPLIYSWNLQTQYEFVHNWVLEVGYVGSHGIHQPSTNPTGSANLAWYYNVPSIATPANPINCGYDGVRTDCITTTTTANVGARVPFIGFSPVVSEAADLALYKFNSLQATVRKQLSHGLEFQASYTWSNALATLPWGTNPPAGTNNYAVVNTYERNPQYRPQRLIVNYSWTLPFHRDGRVGYLTNGWGISGVTTIQNGLPINITDSSAGSAFGVVGSALSNAQWCSGVGPSMLQASGGVDSRVLNGLAGGSGYFAGIKNITTGPPANQRLCGSPGVLFANIPAIGGGTATGFGNVGPGTTLGPGQNNWDASITKLTRVGGIREDATLQFRAEFFNAWNHPQFGNPGANVNAATFGRITTNSVNARLIQFALKYAF